MANLQCHATWLTRLSIIAHVNSNFYLLVYLVYCILLYYVVLHYTVLYCIVLYFTILYYIVLYFTLPYHINNSGMLAKKSNITANTIFKFHKDLFHRLDKILIEISRTDQLLFQT